jgi:outer membrane lipoprotein-sorting protein
MTITRRLLTLGLALAPFKAFAQRAALAPADQALVDRAVAYLQNLTRAKGRFTQTDMRGKTATGDIYLQRPGKARLAYDAPNQLLVISDGNQVAVHDKRLNTFELYALKMSPLSLFLAKEIRLDRGVRITDVRRGEGGTFSLTASDVKRETGGSITLVFNENPIALREWTVVDAQGARTRIAINALAPVASLDKALFEIHDPRPRGGGLRP